MCRWIEACTEEELPPTTELEQALRNGVILCKLGHYCSPEVIPLKKIYDLDESRYRVRGRGVFETFKCKMQDWFEGSTEASRYQVLRSVSPHASILDSVEVLEGEGTDALLVDLIGS